MNSILNFFLISILLINNLSSQVNTKTDVLIDTTIAKKFAENGEKKYEANDFEGAVNDFTKAIENNNTNYKYYLYRSDCKNNLQKYSEALIDINKALSLNKNDRSIYQVKGSIEKSLKKYEDAIIDYTTLIELSPKNSEGYFSRGECFFKLKKFDLAFKDVNDAISLKPKEPKLYKFRGLVNYYLKNYRNSISDYKMYFSIGGKEGASGISFYVGMSYYGLQNYDSAIVNLSLYASNHSDAETFLYLAVSYRLTNDTLNARKNFILSIESNPRNAETYLYYANMELSYNNCEKTLELLENYLKYLNEVRSASEEFYKDRAIAKACVQDTSGSLKDFEKAIQVNKNNYKIYQERIRVLISNSNYDSIVSKDITKSISLCNDSNSIPFLYNLRAYLKSKKNDTLGAESDLLKAVEFKATKAFIFCNLAAHYLFLRKDEKYKNQIYDNLNKALKLDKNYLETYRLLAYAYYTLDNNIDKACKILQEAEKWGKNEDIQEMKKRFCNTKTKNINLENINMMIFIFTDGSNELMNYLLVKNYQEGNKYKTYQKP